jgi:hypothetical protein
MQREASMLAHGARIGVPVERLRRRRQRRLRLRFLGAAIVVAAVVKVIAVLVRL